MEDHDDFAFEPVPGLPEKLPQGETMLWQGSPEWRDLARSAFHVRKVVAYFGLVLAWQVASALRSGQSLSDLGATSLWVAALCAAAVAILCLLAWLYARGTIYTLTTRRIVIRSGLALPVTLNLPLALVESAAVAGGGNRHGSIVLEVTKPNRVAWLVLWPNARPWRFNDPQPMLRCIDNVAEVSRTLAGALRGDLSVAPVRATKAENATAPVGVSVAA
ncbi:MAG: PH domain-containing protein [Rhizobiaceae bacterium]|nr:PH domain-containing protein [Rhizobiaceae bacterium]